MPRWLKACSHQQLSIGFGDSEYNYKFLNFANAHFVIDIMM